MKYITVKYFNGDIAILSKRLFSQVVAQRNVRYIIDNESGEAIYYSAFL